VSQDEAVNERIKPGSRPERCAFGIFAHLAGRDNDVASVTHADPPRALPVVRAVFLRARAAPSADEFRPHEAIATVGRDVEEPVGNGAELRVRGFAERDDLMSKLKI
jgi:hypothetical protein